MHLSSVFPAALLVLAHLTDAAPKTRPAADALTTRSPHPPPELLVRREWRNLTKPERLEYIQAVKCLQSQPPRFQSHFPGSRSRYDDLLGLHINMTDFIHFNAIFIAWHRYYLWLFERELREVCGYPGGQPYWDWTKDASLDLSAKSPLFDTEYGFGGNGAYIANVTGLAPNAPFPVPDRTGGGCVVDGPFANMSVHMGPGFNLSYNPHCMRRDFSPEIAAEHLNSSVISAGLGAEDFYVFNRHVQGFTGGVAGFGFHAGGHWAVGGQVGELTDFYSSPGDHLFWLHHAMLDNVWDEWQRRDWPARRYDFSGPDKSSTYPFNFNNSPDIPYTNLTNTNVSMSFAPYGPNITVDQVMDIQHMCGGGYVYLREDVVDCE